MAISLDGEGRLFSPIGALFTLGGAVGWAGYIVLLRHIGNSFRRRLVSFLDDRRNNRSAGRIRSGAFRGMVASPSGYRRVGSIGTAYPIRARDDGSTTHRDGHIQHPYEPGARFRHAFRPGDPSTISFATADIWCAGSHGRKRRRCPPVIESEPA